MIASSANYTNIPVERSYEEGAEYVGEEAEVGQGLVPHDAEECPDKQHLHRKSPNCIVLSSIINRPGVAGAVLNTAS